MNAKYTKHTPLYIVKVEAVVLNIYRKVNARIEKCVFILYFKEIIIKYKDYVYRIEREKNIDSLAFVYNSKSSKYTQTIHANI